MTIAPVKAGWLVKDRGQWHLTDLGRAALESHTDPAKFAREASRLYKLWEEQRPESENEEEQEVTVSAAATLEEAEEAAWSELENYLAELNPYDFQDLVAGLLKGKGYHVSYVSRPGADKGIDIVAHTDPLGIKTPTIKVQVKRRQDKANVDSIRAFLAVLSGSDVGLFVCTGGFTKDAEEEARGQQLRRIMLINLKRLYALWVEHYSLIPEEHRHLLPLKPVYYLALPD